MNNNNDTFTKSELHHLDTLQSRADAEVSNPNSSFYEPEQNKRRSSARKLMQQWEVERAEAHRTEVIAAELQQAASYFSTHPVLDMSPGDLKERGTEIQKYLENWPKSEQELWIEYYEDEM